jgi:LuxR family maltose regulon positive regulatory protein
MPITVLTTKLHIPPMRREFVPRPRLFVRLDDGTQRKLTLISAPAGFGKSTLVAEWLAQRPARAAWLSLEEDDNDPLQFWTYVIAAFQQINAAVGIEAGEILNAAQLRTTRPIVISLLNDLTQFSDNFVLVLDDYHLIETQHIHHAVDFLLEYQPPNSHMVLITRVDPPLSLARLRAHGQLGEIRATDLQFTEQEASILLNTVMRFNLSSQQVSALVNRTEGWAVGLHLAALSLKNTVAVKAFIEQFTGSHQFVLDYLTEEVLRGLPESQRRFLLQTSILDRFNEPLCRAVVGGTVENGALSALRSSNLFLTPLDEQGEWFRYHQLFAELLRALLQRDYPERLAELHLNAAAWFAAEGFIDEAVKHALRSGDMAYAKDLIVQHWSAMTHQGKVSTVLRWLDALPAELNQRDLGVALARCWALHLSGQTSAIVSCLTTAETLFEQVVSAGNMPVSQQNVIASQLSMMESVLARVNGDHAAAVAHAEDAVRIVPQDVLHAAGPAWNLLGAARIGAGDLDGGIAAFEHGIELAYTGNNLLSAFVSIFGQAVYLAQQGHLNTAEEKCRAALDRATGDGHAEFPATGLLHIALARLALERNKLDEAETHLSAGLQIARSGGFSEAIRFGRYTRAHLAAARGNIHQATRIFEDAEPIIVAMDDPYLTGELNREWARVCLLAGDLESARQRLAILEEKSTATHHPQLHSAHAWMAARLFISIGCYSNALAILADAIHDARTAHSYGELIRLLALQSVALTGNDNPVHARTALLRAVDLGAPQGYIRQWLDAGPALVPSVKQLRDGAEAGNRAYLDLVVAACQVTFGAAAPPPRALLNPLSDRELAVLRLIDEGCSNREIAEKLVVTLHTVKKHTSNIYSKLGVASRTQAVARARELCIL